MSWMSLNVRKAESVGEPRLQGMGGAISGGLGHHCLFPLLFCYLQGLGHGPGGTASHRISPAPVVLLFHALSLSVICHRTAARGKCHSRDKIGGWMVLFGIRLWSHLGLNGKFWKCPRKVCAAPSSPSPPATVLRRHWPLPTRGTRPGAPSCFMYSGCSAPSPAGSLPQEDPREVAVTATTQRPPSRSVLSPRPPSLSLRWLRRGGARRQYARVPAWAPGRGCVDSLVRMSRRVRGARRVPKTRSWRIFSMCPQAGAGRWAEPRLRDESGFCAASAFQGWGLGASPAKGALTSSLPHPPLLPDWLLPGKRLFAVGEVCEVFGRERSGSRAQRVQLTAGPTPRPSSGPLGQVEAAFDGVGVGGQVQGDNWAEFCASLLM